MKSNANSLKFSCDMTQLLPVNILCLWLYANIHTVTVRKCLSFVIKKLSTWILTCLGGGEGRRGRGALLKVNEWHLSGYKLTKNFLWPPKSNKIVLWISKKGGFQNLHWCRNTQQEESIIGINILFLHQHKWYFLFQRIQSIF